MTSLLEGWFAKEEWDVLLDLNEYLQERATLPLLRNKLQGDRSMEIKEFPEEVKQEIRAWVRLFNGNDILDWLRMDGVLIPGEIERMDNVRVNNVVGWETIEDAGKGTLKFEVTMDYYTKRKEE